jgi:dihydrofolate synthase/folylpolyglutamate synthase
MQVIASRAGACGAALIAADDRLVERVEFERGRATVTYRTPVARYERVRLGLSGAHQVGNAAVAIRALETFAVVSPQVNAAAVLAAARDVEWPARLEWLRLAGDRFVLIDAAHNPSGAAALADYARASGIAPLPVVLAMMKDKDARGIIAALAPIASSIVATDVGSPRALPAGDLAAAIAAHAPALPVAALTPPDQALRQALATSPRVVVAGSIFLVGPIRASLIEAGARPAAGPL